MGDKLNSTPTPLHFSFVPVHTQDAHGRRSQRPVQQSTWWKDVVAWFRYHSTQTRWDIERALARLFHRRWGI